MVDDLRTQPDRDRVAELIAAADRLATPRDFEIIDRRPIRRGGVIAAIVVAGVLLGLVSITTLGGGGDATADDRIGTTAAPVARHLRHPMSHRSADRANGRRDRRDPAGRCRVTSSVTAIGDRCPGDDQRDHELAPPARRQRPAPRRRPARQQRPAPTATTDPTATATASAPSTDATPVRYAVYSGGKVYLAGAGAGSRHGRDDQREGCGRRRRRERRRRVRHRPGRTNAAECSALRRRWAAVRTGQRRTGAGRARSRRSRHRPAAAEPGRHLDHRGSHRQPRLRGVQPRAGTAAARLDRRVHHRPRHRSTAPDDHRQG